MKQTKKTNRGSGQAQLARNALVGTMVTALCRTLRTPKVHPWASVAFVLAVSTVPTATAFSVATTGTELAALDDLNVVGFMVMQSHPDFIAFAHVNAPAFVAQGSPLQNGTTPVSMICIDNDDTQGLFCALDVFTFDLTTLKCGNRIGREVSRTEGLSILTVQIPQAAYDDQPLTTFCASVTQNGFQAGALHKSAMFTIAST